MIALAGPHRPLIPLPAVSDSLNLLPALKSTAQQFIHLIHYWLLCRPNQTPCVEDGQDTHMHITTHTHIPVHTPTHTRPWCEGSVLPWCDSFWQFSTVAKWPNLKSHNGSPERQTTGNQKRVLYMWMWKYTAIREVRSLCESLQGVWTEQ